MLFETLASIMRSELVNTYKRDHGFTIWKRLLKVMVIAASLVFNMSIAASAYTNTLHVTDCGNLKTPDTLYILDNDVRSEGSCFSINADNVAFDLNGHTITYDDYPEAGLINADFEEGQGSLPTQWDLTMAKTVERRPTSELPLVNKWYIRMGKNSEGKSPDGSVIKSDWVSLPPNVKGVVYFVRGDAIWTYENAPLWTLKIESDQGSVVYEDALFTEKRAFVFNTLSTAARYRAVLTMVQGFDFIVKTSYPVLPSIDLFDIRPYRNFGIQIYNRENVSIKNGRIVQGRGKSWEGHAIQASGLKGTTIRDLNIYNEGLDSSAIYLTGTDNKVLNCNIVSRNPFRLSRGQIEAPIAVYNSSNVLISGNTIDSGEGWGCIYIHEHHIEVSNNVLKTKSAITNHHAINMYVVHDIFIHDNVIEADPGQGIMLSRLYNGDIYNNQITIKSYAPNAEYGYYQVDAITYKDYVSGVGENVKIRNNNITVYSATDPYFYGFGEEKDRVMTGILAAGTGRGNIVSDNIINMISVDPSVKIAGINSVDAFDNGVFISDNIITSDVFAVMFGGYASGGNSFPHNIQFQGNTISKGSNPDNFHTIGFTRGGNITTEKLHFIDTKMANGASMQDVSLADYGDFSYGVDASVDINVRDGNGRLLHGVDVTINTQSGEPVFNGKTVQGELQDIPLTIYRQTGNAYAGTNDTSYMKYYTVTMSAAGVSDVKEISVPENSLIEGILQVASSTIKASAEAGGSISPGGEIVVPIGQACEFQITPQVGYKVADVIVDNVSIGPVDQYTLVNDGDNHIIDVTFEYVGIMPQPPVNLRLVK